MIDDNEAVRVLVAEDDYLVCQDIVRTLTAMGYEVVGTALDGEKAVEAVCRLRPDVVLVDIEMPHLDGLSAARKIRECCPTPVVILTAYESKDFLTKASEQGVAAYLTKPPDPQQIERAIIIAIARHKDLMELHRLHAEVAEKNGELAAQNERLEKTLAEVKTLRGLIPICMYCKKVRNDSGFWENVEMYVRQRTEAEFSHGLCPECFSKHYPDMAPDMPDPS